MVSSEYHKQHEAAMDYSATLNGRALKNFNRAVNEYTEWFTLIFHKFLAQDRFAASIAAFLAPYSIFPDLT